MRSHDLREQLQRTLGTTYTIERKLGGGTMSPVFSRQLGRHGCVQKRQLVSARGIDVVRGARAPPWRVPFPFFLPGRA